MDTAPHRTMTPEEYAAMPIKGWHQVCKDVDGFGGVGIRMGTEVDVLRAEVERLTKWIARIDSMNDHPGRFNSDINYACIAATKGLTVEEAGPAPVEFSSR